MTHEFVDTNVLLYAYDQGGDRRHGVASALIAELGRARAGVLSVQVLQEFYVNVTRKVEVPLSAADAQETLRALTRWPVHSPLAHDVIAAAEIADSTRISFWDAMVIRSASQMGCRVLWSEDLNSGQSIAGVEVRNPFGTR
ncbi:PIN domain-containing protein [Gordonia pseudamarae]|jgi:predicted nucleic acid-binding protein|uniref:Ribonuclease VapC n=1 Tax=Gordonia pseudamarae TaxID=2831662 RepID=A0ABX6IK33_9ACTN|nr:MULTISPECIES: PIN domain-containing protein [Gordonia]MBD0022987.1 PIN domain-containing protein [Gordonia sp. (in: high G+C Gram-positive bacteria)]QHN26757.1 PIN domain-containing protein [Gordonia pseudamarae]QHN35650.1 PIN domain-containing protein [Gordonia pseudamarae]